MDNSLLYGFQISPGHDQTLHYAFDLDAAVKEASDLRLEFFLDNEERDLPPTAIYEFQIQEIPRELLLAVLNERLTLPQVMLTERRLVRLLE